MKRLAADAFLGLLLMAAVGGRIARETGPWLGAPAPAGGFEANAEVFMAGFGWSPGERLAITRDFTYAARVFQKEGCPPLLVSVVGAGGDAEGLFRRSGGPVWRFLHGGRAYDRPPTVRFMLDAMIAAAVPGVEAPPPIMAVAYAEGGRPPQCEGPTAQQWRTMARVQAGLRTSAE